jgi:Mg-chelatase subunit ChlD
MTKLSRRVERAYHPSMLRTPLGRLVIGFLTTLLFAGCVDGLRLVRIDSSAKKPSNVAVYFTVDTSAGQPVPGLAADKFTIYEDGSKVSEFESKQTILNPRVAAAHDTLLLIDMSGSVVESKRVDDVVAAATQFTQRVEKFQKVGVYAFDGSPDLYPIVPFTDSESAATGGVVKLKTFKPKDPSTNLNGAVVEALKVLQRTLAQETKPLRFGTLVVFTDGTDRAARVSKHDLDAAVNAPEYGAFDIFAIGVGAEMNDSHLEDIGRTGTVKETDQANLGRAFDQIGARIEGMTARYYLLSYCTPSRAGEHEVRIEAHGDRDTTGSLTYKFVADGFGPTCDPNTPPSFDLAHPAAAPPPEVKVVVKAAPPPRPATKAVTVTVAAPSATAAPPAATATATETFAP